jgi:hypothetical protein
MQKINRLLVFEDEICIACGCTANLYQGKEYKHIVVALPTDHYDFLGPIKPEGKTLEEIKKLADSY